MPARKRGRPTKYAAELSERVVLLGSKGKSKAQIAAEIGVTRETIDIWAREHPEFSDAIKQAIELALAWWEDQGQAGLTAEKFNATAFIFQMKNRFRKDYFERTEHSGPGGGPVETIDVAALANLSDDDIERLIVIRAKIAAAGSASGGEGPTAKGEGA